MKYLILIFSLFFSINALAINVKAPVKTVVGTGSYTVPAGKWARVIATVSASARVSSGSNVAYSTIGVSANSTTIELILKSGDVISSSLSNASGAAACSNVGVHGVSSSESVASVLVNSINIGSARAPVTATCLATTSSGSLSMTGSTSYGYLASEYFN